MNRHIFLGFKIFPYHYVFHKQKTLKNLFLIELKSVSVL